MDQKPGLVTPPVAIPVVESPPPPSGFIATLRVTSVAASSAVCEIVSSTEPVEVGDVAKLAAEEVKEQQKEIRLKRGRSYPQIITFTTGDPVVEEERAAIPRPPSPEINRMRGRIGFEYSSVISRNVQASASDEFGMVARFDMNRIGGTFWNFSGYWRGRFTTLSGPAVPATISDLINRTYHLSMTYNNPESRWVAGGGRLYVPFASSLDTIDGAYIGRKAGTAKQAVITARGSGGRSLAPALPWAPEREKGVRHETISGHRCCGMPDSCSGGLQQKRE